VKHRFAVRAGAFLVIALLVTAGRWVGSAGTPVGLLIAGSYGLLAAGIAAFTVDLVLVFSLLQRKILCIRILGISFLALAAADGFLSFSPSTAAIILAVSAILVGVLLAVDALRSGGPDLRIAAAETPARRYLRRRPLKSTAETLLRLFPSPEPVGLYRIGSPGGDAPVVVTGNYELTLRRVVRRLRSASLSLDCWLLVCDSRGVNVWCGSMAGHFTTDSVVRAIERTNLPERVTSRRLILPQLCASSVSPEVLRTRTGFEARFGPLAIGDLGAYLSDPADPLLRRARFPLGARLEMALGCPLMLSVLLILLYNFIGPLHLLVVLPALYLASLLHGVIFPYRPLKRIGVWALCYGAMWFLGAGLLCWALVPAHRLLYALTIGIGSAYLVTEFSGWSPLIKYSLIPYQRPRVEVDRDSCIGCRRCVEVCPVGVFRLQGGRSTVAAGDRCVICRSCFTQCPTGAVRHSHAPL
jgi:NAD-dependent dihydropyrimidine dehydrogenase PreA subunit